MKRKRPSIPTEGLSSDREEEFCHAEKKTEELIAVNDKGFPGQRGEGIDLPKRERSQGI